MHMEQWSIGDEFEDEQTSRILSLATGNIQTHSTTTQHDHAEGASVEHQQEPSNPAQVDRPSTNASSSLTSGGNHDLNRRRHAFKRLRRRFEISLRYQQRPEYRRYLSRHRKDTDKKGDIIWTDAMEEAFTNALVNIPPMGRRKRSQHGKSFGRNELIVEWILHETGVMRKRKQISSHIQVLDIVFSKFPEWKKLTKTPSATAAPEPELYDYYNDSVADMVRNWPALKGLLVESLLPEQKSLLTAPILRSNDSFSDRHPLSRLDFDMWIGPSVNVDKCLHRYTRTAGQDTFFNSTPHRLENIEDWRRRFPDLENIMAEFPTSGSCDIIHFEACIQTMTDFPLEDVKLGINFQLEFSNIECRGLHESGCLESFSCMTRIYRDGKFVRQADVDNCQVVGRGKVKPPFESRWWAQEFVRLTDGHRMAEESGSKADMEAALESTTNFFDGLTILQQIYTCPTRLRNLLYDKEGSPNRQRAAILLWQFSHAKMGETPLTVVRKLIPASVTTPDESSSSSHITTYPHDFMHAPNDTATAALFADTFESMPNFDTGLMQENFSDPEELCQDGFMITVPQPAGVSSTQFASSSSANAFDHILPDSDPPRDLHDPTRQNLVNTSVLDMPFYGSIGDLGSHITYVSQSHHTDRIRDVTHLDTDRFNFFAPPEERRPLEIFDAGTHDMLQAQMTNARTVIRANNRTEHNELAQSDHHHGLNHTLTSKRKVFSVEDTQPVVTNSEWNTFGLPTNLPNFTTMVPRPQLQHYHSFAGILPTEDTPIDTTSQMSFTQLIEQLERNQGVDSHPQQNALRQIDANGTERSQSQPAPDQRFDHNEWLLQHIGLNNGWTDVKVQEASQIDKRDAGHSLCM